MIAAIRKYIDQQLAAWRFRRAFEAVATNLEGSDNG